MSMDFSPEEYEEILNIYCSESEEIIQRMNSCVLLLENDNSNNSIIDKLFRDAHSLKGASRMVGFDKIQLIAHRLEDLLDLAHTEKIYFTSETVTLFYKALDCLSRIIRASVEKKREFIDKETQETIELLENTVSTTEKAPKPKAAETQKIEKIEFTQEESNAVYKTIECISNILETYDADGNNEFPTLLDNFVILSEYFQDQKCYKIKNLLTNAVDKLKFVQAATGFLVDFEIEDFKEQLSSIKSELDKSLGKENKVEQVEQGEQAAEVIQTSYKDSVEQLIQILDRLEDEPENISQAEIILSNLIEYTKDSPLGVFYEEINKICNNFRQKSILITGDLLKLLTECISDCANFYDSSENATFDIDSIMQRLSIATQVIDLQEKSDTQSIIITDNKDITNSEKPVNAKEFFTNFENVSIKTLRVDTAKLDKLVNQMSELIVSRIKIQDHLKELQNVKHKIEELADAQNRLIRLGRISAYNDTSQEFSGKQLSINNTNAIKNEFEKIYESFTADCEYYNQSIDELSGMIKNIRVLPIATIFHQFPRMVRDIAIEKNKKIELLISGAETTVDKKIIEEIKSPLIHIIRNSIDHGIETPEERISHGKPEVGKIIISAKNLSNKIVIEIKDDGRGVNIEKIKRKALATGLLSEVEMKQLNDEQIMNLIFLPGFSTGENVTEISGRGIGLDVVQSKITQLEGKVSVLSETGKGATLRIELPLSLATIQAFIVQSGELFFAIPILAVLSVKNIFFKDIFIKDDEKNIILDNQTVKVYMLSELLNLEKQKDFEENEKLQLIILEIENEKIGLVVDNIEGDFEILQKKFSPPIFKLRFISGITTLTSGRICYILNISDIFKHSQPDKTKSLIESKERLKSLNKISEQKNKKILIFDNTENINNLNSVFSSFSSECKITNDAEELIFVLSKEDYSSLSFFINKDFENIFKLIYELKNNEMYSSLKISLACCGANPEIQKAFKSINLDAVEFVQEMDSDTYIYCAKKFLS